MIAGPRQESSLTTREPLRAPLHVMQATTSKGLAQCPYVVARVGMQGTELTTEPPCPLKVSNRLKTVVYNCIPFHLVSLAGWTGIFHIRLQTNQQL